MSSDLEHYGVKGMKWGVRRTQKQIDSYNRIAKGQTKAVDVVRFMHDAKVSSLIKNKGNVRKTARGRAAFLEKRVSRIKSGNATARDRVSQVLHTPVWDIVQNR